MIGVKRKWGFSKYLEHKARFTGYLSLLMPVGNLVMNKVLNMTRTVEQKYLSTDNKSRKKVKLTKGK